MLQEKLIEHRCTNMIRYSCSRSLYSACCYEAHKTFDALYVTESHAGTMTVQCQWHRDLEDNHYGGCISSDGHILASSSAGKVLLWDAETGNRIAAYGDHTDALVRMCFSQDRAFVCTVSKDKTARVWRVPSRTLKAVNMTVTDLSKAKTVSYISSLC